MIKTKHVRIVLFFNSNVRIVPIRVDLKMFKVK